MQIGKRRRRSGTAQEIASSKRYTVSDLLEIMASLRGPRGCPWDREQTEQTLKKFLIEEAYETLEAIESGTAEALKEELGDLLLQIVFLSQLAEEKKEFNFADVVHTLSKKLIHRHPHVFPPSHERLKKMKPESAQDVIKVWGIAKELEGKYAKRNSLLDGLPLALPALERSRRLCQRISRVGIDPPEGKDPWIAVEKAIIGLRKTTEHSKAKGAEELGSLLFRLVDWARSRDISAEEALRKANRLFVNRFKKMENGLRKKGKTLRESNPEEWNRLRSKRMRRP